MNKKWWCLFGVHEWKVMSQGPYTLNYIDTGEKMNGNYYNLQCEVCGKLKYKVLMK